MISCCHSWERFKIYKQMTFSLWSFKIIKSARSGIPNVQFISLDVTKSYMMDLKWYLMGWYLGSFPTFLYRYPLIFLQQNIYINSYFKKFVKYHPKKRLSGQTKTLLESHLNHFKSFSPILYTESLMNNKQPWLII